MQTVHLIVSLCLMVLGIVHILATPRFYPLFSKESMWFISGGLALFNGATLNLIMANVSLESAALQYLCHGSNVLLLLFSFVFVRIYPKPQLKLLLILMLMETLLGFWNA